MIKTVLVAYIVYVANDKLSMSKQSWFRRTSGVSVAHGVGWLPGKAGCIVQLLSIDVVQLSKMLIPLKTTVPAWDWLAKLLLSIVIFTAKLSLILSTLLSCSNETCKSVIIEHAIAWLFCSTVATFSLKFMHCQNAKDIDYAC